MRYFWKWTNLNFVIFCLFSDPLSFQMDHREIWGGKHGIFFLTAALLVQKNVSPVCPLDVTAMKMIDHLVVTQLFLAQHG